MSKPIGDGISNKTLTIRLNEAQLEAVKSQATSQKISQSTYLMKLVEKDINENKEAV
jgi:predicted DNA binding CopG/RHH family protein